MKFETKRVKRMKSLPPRREGTRRRRVRVYLLEVIGEEEEVNIEHRTSNIEHRSGRGRGQGSMVSGQWGRGRRVIGYLLCVIRG
jgi:hypothetical protein